jgi:hypothetical protein
MEERKVEACKQSNERKIKKERKGNGNQDSGRKTYHRFGTETKRAVVDGHQGRADLVRDGLYLCLNLCVAILSRGNIVADGLDPGR